jgi:hypothetical protein
MDVKGGGKPVKVLVAQIESRPRPDEQWKLRANLAGAVIFWLNAMRS